MRRYRKINLPTAKAKEKMPLLHFLMICFAVAAGIAFAPVIWPDSALVNILTIGPLYMAVFFHEIGHSIFAWFFGYPSIPVFDFAHGGGMAYHFERLEVLKWFMVAAQAVSVFVFWHLFQEWYKRVIIILPIGLMILNFTLFYHEAVILFMGHGFEIAVAVFCLYRVICDRVSYHSFERPFNGFLGFYFIINGLIFSYKLIFDQAFQSDYLGQKGQHGFGDFSRIADIFMARDASAVAVFYALYILSLMIMLMIYCWLYKRDQIDY